MNWNRVQIIAFTLFITALIVTAGIKDQQAEYPNILFIMSDDHVPTAMSCYGNTDISTPGLDRLAGQGMLFEHALTPNSFCTPSRAILLTGKYSHANGTLRLNEPFDGEQQTYPKLFQKAGYQTAIFGKWHLLTQPTGFDFYCVMKMQGAHFNPRVWETGDKWIPWKNKTTEWREGGRTLVGYGVDAITDEALRWLENRNSDKPFCLLLHPKPPHGPYQPAPRYENFLVDVDLPEPKTLYDDYSGRVPKVIEDKMISNRLAIAPRFLNKLTREQRENWSRNEKTKHIFQSYLKDYYRLVMSVDDNVNKVLDFLKQNGLEDNTIVVYTSDNGFFLGEHGFFDKMWMYEPSIHVPLLVRYPGVVQKGTNSSLVNHADIAPTLLDLAGLVIPEDMQGISLKPLLAGKTGKVRDSFYYHFYRHNDALPEMVGVRTERYKLIHYPGMDEAFQWELFDLKNDADEMTNLYGNPEYQSIMNQMHHELNKLIEMYDDPVNLPAL